ncbi:MAG TPA: DNA (cytosine-5-)-methyltransferase [Methylococcus sp.]|nr:DNA (cytosine-5-)-methyltransferase [Methylococcus sp.]
MTEAPLFRFVDLFAGIGGIRLGFERIGGSCVYSVEWDKYARLTYAANFEVPEGSDVRDVAALPEHDVLLAGFPCQPFSIAGVSKKTSLGRPHGFRDATQGTLFFEIARLAEKHQPPVLFLENVKNLLRHDKGRTWDTIKNVLDELGYNVRHRVVDSRPWVPQKRERVFIVALHRDVYGEQRFEFPDPPDPETGPVLGSILEPEVADKYRKSEHVWDYLQTYAKKHAAAGNGFGYGLVGPEDVTRTLSARYYKDGSEILVETEHGRPPRMLTPRECARLMGFPDSFRIPVSDTQAYKQFGNAVVVPVIAFLARSMVQQGILPVPQPGVRPAIAEPRATFEVVADPVQGQWEAQPPLLSSSASP